MRGTPEHRFWAKVALPDADGCMRWLAAKQPNGYGSFGAGGNRGVRAHRFAYTLAFGPIPDGLEIDHLCKVRDCAAPEHLEAVTRAVNVARSSVSETQRARHAARTHCKRGHEFTPENTIAVRTGRACRTCQRASEKAYRQRRKARRP